MSVEKILLCRRYGLPDVAHYQRLSSKQRDEVISLGIDGDLILYKEERRAGNGPPYLVFM
jgi:hypothetical protein